MDIVISNNISITDIPRELKKELKCTLTLPNPAFESAVKYSPYATINVAENLEYWEKNGSSFEVPIGMLSRLLEYSKFRILDKRIKAPVEYPTWLATLRKDQSAAATMFLLKNRGDDLNGLIQLPTGKGKSILGMFLACQLKQKTLVLVHKTDLVRGWSEDIKTAFGGKLTPGIIQGSKWVIGEQITIATVQTLHKRLSEMSGKERGKFLRTFGLIIDDEVHHSPAATFSIVNRFWARYRCGLSATIERDDGLLPVIGFYFGGTCYEYEPDASDKDILKVRVVKKRSGVYFNPVCKVKEHDDGSIHYSLSRRTAGLDYVLKPDEQRITTIAYDRRPKIKYGSVEEFVMSDKCYRAMVISDVKYEASQNHSCVLFFTQREYAESYAEELNTCGIPTQCFLGGMKDQEEEEALRKAEDKEVLVTCTTLAKSTEGTNVKAWEVAFLVSSMNSGKNVEQAVGRIRRTKPGKMPVGLVYDYRHPNVYMMSSHGNARDSRYSELGFSVGWVDEKPSTKKVKRQIQFSKAF